MKTSSRNRGIQVLETPITVISVENQNFNYGEFATINPPISNDCHPRKITSQGSATIAKIKQIEALWKQVRVQRSGMRITSALLFCEASTGSTAPMPYQLSRSDNHEN